MIRKLKTLIEIDREIWSLTRAFATVNNLTLSDTLNLLLDEALTSKGFKLITPQFSKPEISPRSG